MCSSATEERLNSYKQRIEYFGRIVDVDNAPKREPGGGWGGAQEL
jgi:hypothetical protein